MRGVLNVSVMAVGLAVGLCVSANSEQNSPTSLLRALRAHDEAVLNNAVLQARVAHALALVDTDSERPLLNVKVTRINDTWVYRADLDEAQEPPSHEASNREQTGLLGMGLSRSSGPSDAISVTRPRRTTLLSEPGFHGVCQQNVVYHMRPDDDVEKKTTPHSVDLARWPDPLHDWRIYVPVLASGRGFSYYVDEVTAIEVRQNGLLCCKGVGTAPGWSGKPTPRTWELLIEPGAAYLVRKASASLPDGRVWHEFENEGIIDTTKGPIPRSGRARYGGASARKMYQGDGYSEVSYVGLRKGADEALIAEAQAIFNGKFPPGTQVSDFREAEYESHAIPSEAELRHEASEIVKGSGRD